jgi:uncharacterized membrane protein YadS
MACIRSVGDLHAADKAFGFVDRTVWNDVGATAKVLVPWLLAMAMAAIGLGTGLAKLKNLGFKPFSIGFCAALLVGVVSTLLVKLMANVAHL